MQQPINILICELKYSDRKEECIPILFISLDKLKGYIDNKFGLSQSELIDRLDDRITFEYYIFVLVPNKPINLSEYYCDLSIHIGWDFIMMADNECTYEELEKEIINIANKKKLSNDL